LVERDLSRERRSPVYDDRHEDAPALGLHVAVPRVRTRTPRLLGGQSLAKRPKGLNLWCAFEYLQLSLQFGTLPDKLAKLLH
jgi:hypothetical protein